MPTTRKNELILWVFVVAAVLLVLGLFSLVWLHRIYALVTVAFVGAYLFDPIVTWLEKHKISRTVGSILVLTVSILIFWSLILAFVPKLLSQASMLRVRVPYLFEKLVERFSHLSVRLFGENIFQDSESLLLANISSATDFAKPLSSVVTSVFEKTFGFIGAVLGATVIPLLSFYLLKDFKSLFPKFQSVFPKRYHKHLRELAERLNEVFGGFLRGQLIVSLMLSFYYTLMFVVLRVELGLMLGLVAGFFNIIPYLGMLCIIIITFSLEIVYGAGGIKLALTGLVFIVGMFMEGSFITPKIVGSKVGLTPLALIVALLCGGELGGLFGMVVAVPFVAMCKVGLGYLLDFYLKSESV